MKKTVEKNEKLNYRENSSGLIDVSSEGREHLELLRSSRHFKHVIKKEKFYSPSKLDMMLTKLYLSL